MSEKDEFVGSLLALFKRYGVKIEVDVTDDFYIISNFYNGYLDDLLYPYLVEQKAKNVKD